MLKKLSILAFASVIGFAQSCSYDMDKSSFDMKWGAFKFQSKAKVSGTFNEYKLEATKSDSLKKLLDSSKIVIDTKSVNTKHETRDKTIFDNFFALFNSKDIKANISDSIEGKNSGTINLNLDMNKKSSIVPMSYKIENGKLTATGVTDLNIFDLSGALASINKACYALHQGVTWSQVELEFSVKVNKECK